MLTRPALALIVAGSLVVGALTLTPTVQEGFEAVHGPLAWLLSEWWAMQLFNVLMFVPLGVGVGLVRAPRSLLPVLLAVPWVVETVQIAIPGRFFEVQDLVTNSLGALLGYLAARRIATRVTTASQHEDTRQPADL
jgi:glycopeptide antibiotics resistance protein